MRITLYYTRKKLLQYDTKHKKYVIRFIIKSSLGKERYTIATTLKKAIKLIKEGYH